MKTDICDVKDCAKISFHEIAIRNNYWLGDKILKIDVCREHMEMTLKGLGFDCEFTAKRAEGNQWKKHG